MSSRFGNARVRRGLAHFLLGKIVSAIAGLTAMVLVVRGLSISDFANYSVLIAFVELFTAVSGLGLTHVVLRYVPELYATHRSASLRSILKVTIGMRSALLLAVLAMAWFSSRLISDWFNLNANPQAFELFLVLIAFRSTSHFLAQVLESTLHQNYSQIAFSLAAIGRCVGMLYLSLHGSINLMNVIAMEAICDFLACTILLIGIRSVVRESDQDHDRHQDDTSWWPHNRHAVSKFAMAAYFQHLATLPFGGNTNRLVGGAMFGDRTMANFGFSLSLYEYIKRYLPTQLLIGLIRPIVVARFSESRDFRAAARLCDQSLQLNLFILFGAIAVVLVAGYEMFVFISDGKYSHESLHILIALLVLLCLETHRVVLELLAQMVEKYSILIPSNVLLSLSVLLGVAGHALIGAVAFPLANALALVVANYWVTLRLQSLGYTYQHDWSKTGAALAFMGLSTLSGYMLYALDVHWAIRVLFTGLVYTMLFLKFLSPTSLAFAKELIGKKEK